MSIDQSIDSTWVRAYTPGGFQVGIMVGLMSAAELDAMLTGQGYLSCEPGLEPGQKKETISRVVRRQKHNQDGTVTPIIDFYIDAWNNKYAHLYLNSEADIKQFEAQSGLKLTSLRLYEGNQALDREKNLQLFNQYSQPVNTPFAMVRTPDGEWNTGMPKYEYSYFAEVNLGTTETVTQDDDDTTGGWATEHNLNLLVDKMQATLGVDLYTLGDFAKLAGIDKNKADSMAAWNDKYPTGKDAYEAALKAHARTKVANGKQPETTESPKG